MSKEVAKTPAREVDFDRFLTLFDKTVHEWLKTSLARDGADTLVCFENLQTGERKAVLLGPGCSHTLEDVLAGGRLPEPDQDKDPIEYVRKSSLVGEGNTGKES